MKCRSAAPSTGCAGSLPSRERGLKLRLLAPQPCRWVAPFAGAWIEMPLSGLTIFLDKSLPSRERGLKFFASSPEPRQIRSLPSRERGLKSESYRMTALSWIVAPFAGAWIEIKNPNRCTARNMSLPSRERGLKCRIAYTDAAARSSLPSRERGLK